MSSKRKADDDPGEPEYPALPDLRKSLPIRGRALGFMGPTNPTRLFMYRFLLLPYVVSCNQKGSRQSANLSRLDGQNLSFFF